MTVLPVVAREMSILARRPGTYWVRAGTAVAAMLVTGWLLVIVASQVPVAQLGGKIFSILSYIAFVYAIAAGIHATSDCISEEKREGTLGLLFLTDLKSYDIVLGKLSATSLSAAYALLALLPMIALGVLAGGITLTQLGLVALVLANTLFLSLGTGVFVSTLSSNERCAVFASAVTLFVLTLGPYVTAYSFSNIFDEELTWMSPLFPLVAALTPPNPALGFTPGAYLRDAILLHHLLAWAFLILSCVILPRYINDAPAQKVSWLRAAFARYALGNRATRRSYRARLLDRNAFLWLVSRERAKPKYAWALVLFFFALHFWVFHNFRHLFFDLPVNGAILMIIHFALKLWVASEVCNRLIQDRRAGALELLLSTPLSVREIAHGQALALRRIFFYPILVVVLGELTLMVLGYMSGRLRPAPFDRGLTFLIAASTLVLDVWALKWVGLWRSLWGKSIERVLLATVLRILVVPWAVFFTIMAISAAYDAVIGRGLSYRETLFVFWLVSIGCALFFAVPARQRFFKYFRACAANRFESGKPALEEVRERTPDSAERAARLLAFRRAAMTAGTALLVIIGLILLARNFYWRGKVSEEIARIRRAGEPASFNDLQRLRPPPPPARDAANVLLGAGTPQDRPVLMSAWSHFSSRGLSGLDLAPVNLAPSLRRNERQLSALRQLTNYSDFYFPPAGYGMNFSEYPILGCLDYLQASNEGDTERVFHNVRAVLAFARLMHSYPSIHAQHMALFALQNLKQVLEHRHSLPDEYLAQISADLGAVPRDSVLGEQITSTRAMLLSAHGSVAMHDQSHFLAGVFNSAALYSGGYHKQLVSVAAVFREALEAATLPYPDRLDRCANWAAVNPSSRADKQQPFEERFRWMATDLIWRHAEINARIELLKTAVALQRFARKHHRAPSTLVALVPEYLSSVPIDPFTGQPLKLVDRYGTRIIYSVGRDRADSGGQYAPGDLVYRFK